jgi:hypothetical protein
MACMPTDITWMIRSPALWSAAGPVAWKGTRAWLPMAQAQVLRVLCCGAGAGAVGSSATCGCCALQLCHAETATVVKTLKSYGWH